MPDFPVRFDAQTGTIHLDGKGGIRVLLGLLLKAKFGEAFDPEVLLHEPLAEIMSKLYASADYPEMGEAEGPFTSKMLHIMATRVLDESWRSAWWSMSKPQQAMYLRSVVAAPYLLSDEQVEAMFDSIETGLYRKRQLVETADKAAVR